MSLNVNVFFKSKLLLMVVLFLLYEPPFFWNFYLIDQFYKLMSVIIFFGLIMLVICVQKLGRSFYWICLYFGFIFLITFINRSENVFAYLKDNIATISICLVFILWLNKNPKLLIDCFVVFDIYLLLNFATVLLFPGGLYRTALYTSNWLLGYKNQQIRTILPTISMAIIRSYVTYGKMSVFPKILIAISAITLLLTDSATSLVGLSIFLLALFFFHRNKKELPKLITLFNATLIVIFFFIFIVITRNQEFFSFFIENILGKNLTFTSRTVIWDMSIQYVNANPFFGYGYLTPSNYVKMFGGIEHYAHPHNYIFYNAMMGGICLLGILMLGIIRASNSLEKTSKSIYSKVVLFCMISFFFMGLMESITGTVLLYPMLVLSMEIKSISKISPEPIKSTS